MKRSTSATVIFTGRAAEKARRSAVAHLLNTFFDGSTEAAATLLNVSAREAE